VWSDPNASFVFAWQRCDASGSCTTISGAERSTYTLAPDDLGASVRVEVTAIGAGGTGIADSSLVGPVALPPPPTVVSSPSISGDTFVGSTLTADPGSWSDPDADLTYVWLRCRDSGVCTTIRGVGGPTYTLVAADLRFWIRVDVSASGAGGTTTARSAPTTCVTAAKQDSDGDPDSGARRGSETL
jgi:hypothetical protein